MLLKNAQDPLIYISKLLFLYIYIIIKKKHAPTRPPKKWEYLWQVQDFIRLWHYFTEYSENCCTPHCVARYIKV